MNFKFEAFQLPTHGVIFKMTTYPKIEGQISSYVREMVVFLSYRPSNNAEEAIAAYSSSTEFVPVFAKVFTIGILWILYSWVIETNLS